MAKPIRYMPNVPVPFEGDDTWNLQGILKEVKQGCPSGEKRRAAALELREWYDGESEKYIAFKPSEDALSWLTRPKRVSFITQQAIRKLTSHLYKPGPRTRKVSADDRVDAWYRRVAQDLNLNVVMKRCDQLTHLQNMCALGMYPTGNPRRPLNYHLYERTDFEYWCDPADPRDPVAICTITKVDKETVRFRLWTSKAYYTFFKGRQWGYTPGGWGVARFDPGSSGPHEYGCLPFVVPTYDLPTTELETRGPGCGIAKVNKALNIDKSNLALWVHIYGKPVPWASGCGPEWRPRFQEGGFLILPAVQVSTEDTPKNPTLGYLQGQLDIGSIQAYIRGEADASLQELGVPLTTSVQSDGGGGVMARSGFGIVALDKDLVTYAKSRQPIWDRHETRVCELACRIGATGRAGQPEGLRARLLAVAEDPSLRVVWPEIYPDVPSTDRDTSDQWELENDLTDPVELLMKRQGLTEAEAYQAFEAVQVRKARALQIIARAQALADGAEATAAEDAGPDPVPGTDGDVGDMGIAGGVGPSAAAPPSDQVTPTVTINVAVPPTQDIPAAPVLLPATPNYGGWGTGI